MVLPTEQATANVVLFNLRDAKGLSQVELAEEVNAHAREHGVSISITGHEISRWERGVIPRPNPRHRYWLADYLGVTQEELGFARPRPVPTTPVRGLASQLDPLPLLGADEEVTPRVHADHQQWRQIRRGLNQHRVPLAALAARLHHTEQRIGRSVLLTRPDWLPRQPVDLAEIQVRWTDGPTPVAVTGQERQSASVRPLIAEGRRFQRYTHAVRELDPPRLFENRISYRLLKVAWHASGGGELTCGHTTYFDATDINEAIAHELAAAHLRFASTGIEPRDQPSWKHLPLRRLLGDPFDLARRALLPSIDTLTIRRSRTSASLVLHRRDPAKVAVAGGMYHVLPCGVFQPSSMAPWAQQHDLDPWRNMLREYDEEFLGNLDCDGNAPAPIDYERTEPFRSLNQARREGKLQALCFGIGLDPLTLVGEILTAVVIDDDVFDTVFANLIRTNAEGSIVLDSATRTGFRLGIRFTEDNVNRLVETEPIAPAAAGCLELAWRHRDLLLGR